MAQIDKVEAVAQTKCPSAQFYDFFKYNTSKLVEIAPLQFIGAELIEGEEGCVGNVKLYNYNLGGAKTAKVKIEAIDDVERSITYEVIEGEIKQLYKSFKANFSVVDGSHVKWCIEFEKANDSCPIPDNYAMLATQVTNALDAYFANQDLVKA